MAVQEAVIDPLSRAKDAWPVGWEFKESRPKTAPKLFKLITIELDDVKLIDVLHATTVKTGVPVHIDHFSIEGAGIEIDKLKVSYKRRKASWSQLLNGVTLKHKLSRKYRIDELGKPFVWITRNIARSPRR